MAALRLAAPQESGVSTLFESAEVQNMPTAPPA
jgi:hypothetical protein